MARRTKAPAPGEVTEPTPAQQAHSDFTEELAEIEPAGTLDITIIAPADEFSEAVDDIGPLRVNAAITIGAQGDDFAAQTGETEAARATKPDGSVVVVSQEGHKWRRSAGASEWMRSI